MSARPMEIPFVSECAFGPKCGRHRGLVSTRRRWVAAVSIVLLCLALPRAEAKTAPTITWATPSPISAGTALGSTQLNATANVPGNFSYTPAAGAIPAAGTDALSVIFTPTDTTDYSTAYATVSLVVNGPAPIITTVVGVGTSSYSGDGGPAISAGSSVPTE